MSEIDDAKLIKSIRTNEGMPPAIVSAGAQGQFAWDEFFSARIRNRHTRTAYTHAVKQFLKWIAPIEANLAKITPGMIGQYMDSLEYATPSKKLHMAAIRGFFDVLVLRHVCLLNPAHSVRTERYTVVEGKTPEITAKQARVLLDSIEEVELIDIRDKTLIACLAYTAARAGAIGKLRIKDFVNEGNQYSLRFNEKGGKQRSIPVRHDLQEQILKYLDYVDPLRESPNSPLFRTMDRRKQFSKNAVTTVEICRMVKKRLLVAGLPTIISPHSFRSCVATDLLLQGVALEDVQHLLGHSDARVTRFYDRRQRKVTRNIVERISV